MPSLEPWPWWLTALVLGAIPVAYWISMRRPLGVSGAIARLAFLRSELARDRAEAVAPAGDAELEAALLAATREAFGEVPFAGVQPSPAPAGPGGGAEVRRLGRALTVPATALFLASIAAGGFLHQVGRGGWRLRAGLGEEFAALFGTGAGAALALVAGGTLVGFGAAVATGCTSGHALTGCARRQPGSLLAVACFFAAAGAVSFVLARVLS